VPAHIVRALCAGQAPVAHSQGFSDPKSMRDQFSGNFPARGSEESPDKSQGLSAGKSVRVRFSGNFGTGCKARGEMQGTTEARRSPRKKACARASFVSAVASVSPW
jgi:hypothetical protein